MQRFGLGADPVENVLERPVLTITLAIRSVEILDMFQQLRQRRRIEPNLLQLVGQTVDDLLELAVLTVVLGALPACIRS